MFLHSTTDTGVQIRRTVLGQYALHLDGAPIGRVFGDHVIGFTAYDTNGATLGRHKSLDDASAVAHANLVRRVLHATRQQADEEFVWHALHTTTPVSV
jgi:hypothetical protein